MNPTIPDSARTVSISCLEQAINAWRNLQPTDPDTNDLLVLDSESRCLADLYGLMIYNGWDTVPLAALSQDQQAALIAAEE